MCYNSRMKYSLGLDIGTTSVGWAVINLDKSRIEDLGVRIFEKPEDPQSGDSLAKPRRDARSARRRLKRRRQRLNQLKYFFLDQKLLTDVRVEEVLSPTSSYNKIDVYELRKDALIRILTAEELLKVLYQISKRRGFKSNRKSEEESDKEGGRVVKALSANKEFLIEKNYQTVGSALNEDGRFSAHKRNKRDDYTNSFSRADYLDELEKIISKQREGVLKGVKSSALKELVYGVVDKDSAVNANALMYQRPFMTKELIEKMVGDCTFEKGEKRAPRASYSFESFRLASDLSHLVYLPKGSTKRTLRTSDTPIRLTSEQIEKVIAKAREQKTLTYKKVREIAGIGDDYVPEYIRGKISEDDPHGEKNDFGGLAAYHEIKTALKNLPENWKKVANEAALNEIAYVLTVQRADDSIFSSLKDLPISNEAKQAILRIKPTRFKTFGNLSIKALQKITPYIIAGNTYDKACELAEYDFRKKSASLEQITNPVVRRAISQTNKVVRAVIREYGNPYFIKIETARDLAKNFRDRKTIENENKENQAKNQQIVDQIKEYGISTPNGIQIIKMKLHREQNGACPYSGKPINPEQMLHDDNAFQIDHIVPFSRSNNDSLTNKVLVLTSENQAKANHTPYEYFGSDEQRWQQFVARVNATYITRDVKTADRKSNHDNYKYNGYALKKKQNLLLEVCKNDSWNIRALNDTRYTTRFIQNYLRQIVDFAEGDDKQRILSPNGAITAYLRKRWGLAKDRSEDVLHHAKDAALIAAINPAVVYRANQYSKSTEMKQYLTTAKTIEEKASRLLDLTDKETGEVIEADDFSDAQFEKKQLERKKLTMEVMSDKKFPEPWDRFREEVDWRTRVISTNDLRSKMRNFDSYDDDFVEQLRPIFISRVPRRKTTGQAHKETIRSPKVKDDNQRTTRMFLKNVKRKDVENSVLAESDKWLYDKLLERLDANGDNPEKAFAEPVYKNDKKTDKNGKPLSPVTAIKVYSTQPSGFLVNGGKAFVNNGSMVRIDVYQKTNPKGKIEHFFVPVYTHQIPDEKRGEKITKILPAPKGFTDVDDTFIKITSLHPNDYARFVFGNKIEEGYYVGYGVAAGQAVILPHFAADKSQKNLLSISPRSATKIQRLDISVLGDNYQWI